MYLNYKNDRRLLGYECLNDSSAINLILVRDKVFVFAKNFTANGKKKFICIVGAVIITFANIECVEAVQTAPPPHRVINTALNLDNKPLIEISKTNSDFKLKMIMPSFNKTDFLIKKNHSSMTRNGLKNLFRKFVVVRTRKRKSLLGVLFRKFPIVQLTFLVLTKYYRE